MTPLLAAEIYKLRKRPACRVMAFIGIGAVAFFYVMFGFLLLRGVDASTSNATVGDLRDMTALRNSAIFGFGVTQLVASILGIVLMSLAITSEFSWRTVITTVNWSGERARLLVARVLVVLGFLAAGVGLGWAVAAAGSIAIGLADGSLSTNGIDAGFAAGVLASWARTWLTVAVYAMLAAALASISRNLAVGIGVAIVVRFLEPLGVQMIDLLPGFISSFKHLLIAPNIDALLQANGTLDGVDRPERDLPSAFQATIYLIGFCFASGAVAVSSFVRQDIDV